MPDNTRLGTRAVHGGEQDGDGVKDNVQADRAADAAKTAASGVSSMGVGDASSGQRHGAFDFV